jgi:hypothetical protein
MNYKFIRTIISRLYYKCFTIVTYNRNDSTLYYKTTLLVKARLILANLALAKSLNYESIWIKSWIINLLEPLSVACIINVLWL